MSFIQKKRANIIKQLTKKIINIAGCNTRIEKLNIVNKNKQQGVTNTRKSARKQQTGSGHQETGSGHHETGNRPHVVTTPWN